MSKVSVKSFATPEEAEVFLNGGITLRCPSPVLRVEDIVGKTLIFTNPNVTVTFVADGMGSALTLKAIIGQIRAAAPGLMVRTHKADILEIFESNPVTPVSVSSLSTAASIFGFKATTTGKIFLPATATPTAPCLLQLLGNGSGPVQCVIYEVTP